MGGDRSSEVTVSGGSTVYCEYSLEVPQEGTSHEHHNMHFHVEIIKISEVLRFFG